MEDKILKILDKVGERSLFPSEAYDLIRDLIRKEVEGMKSKPGKTYPVLRSDVLNDLLLKLEGKK